MKDRTRTPWIDVPVQVSFEETTMEVLLRGGGGFQKRNIVTTVFRLPDGTEFTGRRVSPELRQSICMAAAPKGSVKSTFNAGRLFVLTMLGTKFPALADWLSDAPDAVADDLSRLIASARKAGGQR